MVKILLEKCKCYVKIPLENNKLSGKPGNKKAPRARGAFGVKWKRRN
jgi:hypothetical protein